MLTQPGLRTEVILVRVDEFSAYLIQEEAMEVDWPTVAPVFQEIVSGLELGPGLTPQQKQKRSKWQ